MYGADARQWPAAAALMGGLGQAACAARRRAASFALGLLAFLPPSRVRAALARLAAELVGPWVLLAAGQWTFPSTARTSLLNGTFDLDSDSFMVALFLSTSNLGSGTTTYAGVTNEHANANGYTTGGKATTLTLSGGSTVSAAFSAVTWTAIGGPIVARFAALYEASGNVLAYCLLDDTPADVTVKPGDSLRLSLGGVLLRLTARRPAGNCVEVGNTLYGTDWAKLDSAPKGGFLVSMWTRILETSPSGYPWARGNLEVFMVGDRVWYLRCIVGNIGITDANNATYNANVMFFAELDGDHVGDWVGDYAYYNGAHTEAEVRGWVWVAWQVLIEGEQFRFRQWLKFGTGGSVFLADEEVVTFAAIRAELTGTLGWTTAQAAAWTPGPPTFMRFGADQGPAYLWHPRVDERAAAPTLPELERMASATAYDPEAWADWALSWHDSAADLDDGGAYSRDLTIEAGGTLYDGIAAPF